jgi:hypothetical protein
MSTRPGFWAVLIAGVFAAATVSAQEKPLQSAPGSADTLRIVVTGRVVFEYVTRSVEIAAPREGTAAPAEDADFTEGHSAVRFDVTVGSVTAIVEVGTRRIANQAFTHWADSDMSFTLREALVVVPDFLLKGLSLEIGITRWSFDVRGRGSPIAFDPRRSQTIIRNIDSLGDPVSEELGNARITESGFPDELLSVGVVIVYRIEMIQIDLVMLPAVEEGGFADADESLYALDALLKLDEAGSRLAAIIALSTFPDALGVQPQESAMITAGLGLVLRDILLHGLEIYAEGYYQFGDAGVVGIQVIRAAGYAFQAGIEYNHVVGNPMPIWAGFNFTLYSGDDDTFGGGDTKVNRFAGYENVNDLLIIESMYYGFDIDSNLMVYKVNVGTKFATLRENDLQVDVTGGYARQAEPSNLAGGTSRIGIEIDVKANWELTKQFAIKSAFAILLDSVLVRQSAFTANAGSMGWLWFMGFDLRF